MKSLLSPGLFLIILFFTNFEKASAQSWLWGKAIGGLDSDDCWSITIDPESGDVYTSGYFTGSVDFDPGPGSFILNSGGSQAMFISKLDNDGNFIWAKSVSANNRALAIDESGNVYTTGTFYGTVDFDPGAGIYNLTSPQYYYFSECWDEYCGCYYDCSYYGYSTSIFISKLDESGNFLWAKSMNGSINSYMNSLSISIDPTGSGAIYTTGFFVDTVDFNPGGETFNLISIGNWNTFVTKLDISGNFQWARSMGGPGNDWGYALDVDPGNGNVYTTGFFSGTADFDPGMGTFNLTSAGSNDFFISKLNSSGDFVWARSIGGPQSYADLSLTHSVDIAIDPGSGDVYTTGSYKGPFDFDPGVGTFSLTSLGYSDSFISKLDNTGNFVWAKSMGGSNFDSGFSIDIVPSGSGDVYTTGYFSGTVDFDPDTAGVFNLSSNGSQDLFIVRLDAAGNLTWAKAAGGTDADSGKSITVDSDGNAYVAGYFTSPSIVIDTTTLVNHEQTCYDYYGSYSCYFADILILKLEANAPPCATVVTNKNDSGPGSLRDIIYCAVNGSTITFDSSLFNQTITLTSGEIIINKNLTLSGFGETHLTITGKISRIFQLLNGKNLEIENMSLKYANGGNNGGAIFVKGHLTLENVVLEENSENGITKSMTVSNTAVVDIIGNVVIKQ